MEGGGGGKGWRDDLREGREEGEFHKLAESRT